MKTLFILSALAISFFVHAQQGNVYQNIKGTVYDAESKKELEGTVVTLLPYNLTVLTNKVGQFYFNKILVGKYSLLFSYTGFEKKELTNIELTSGKELEITVNLTLKATSLKEITVKSNGTKNAKNEFAVISSRSFSIQDAKLYPATFSDPARMVSNFSGVTIADDGSNGIIVRGNSPKGILWKLNGIEIPNPNHFSLQGSTSGAVSMLSTNIMGSSDFYTGAFPAEFGNAISGIFDLNFRKGNKDKSEYAVSLGGLGLEAAAEGPIGKRKQSSYILNYRYSSLALIGQIMNLNGQLPIYQDISFNLNFNTSKSGTINVFGLGGLNKVAQKAKEDSIAWIAENETNSSMTLNNKLGVLGIEHQQSVSKNSYIKTIASISYTGSNSILDTLNPSQNYKAASVGSFDFVDKSFKISSFFNTRLNPKNVMRLGFIAQQLYFNMNSNYYDDVEKRYKTIFADKGNSQIYQLYIQWKYRPTDNLSVNLGLHNSLFILNKKATTEPRMSLHYKAGNRQAINFAAGIHSKIESLATYFFEDVNTGSANTNPNKNLETPKAIHIILGYETELSSINSKLKLETYYQKLYDIAVEKDSNSGFSTINMEHVFELRGKQPLVSEGEGKNYGIDISLEHPMNNGLYYMINVSLYKSVYTNFMGEEFNTRFGRNYSTNLNFGKEWKISKRKNRLLGINGRLVAMGGLRENAIDLPLSISTGKEEYLKDKYFTVQNDTYYRLDISLYTRTNKKKSTNTFSIEIQNATNRLNVSNRYFDRRTATIKKLNQLGLFPNLNYKIQF